MTSYYTAIMQALSRLGKNGTANPDAKTKQGGLLGELFLWQTVSKFADAKLKAAREACEAGGLILNDTTPGANKLIAHSKVFQFTASVTEPVKRFDEDALVTSLNKSKYRIPAPIAREFILGAKLPGNPKITRVVSEK